MLFGIGGGKLLSVNHDFTLRKKKERKKINVWYIGLFCQVHWVTHVGNFLSQV